MQIFQGDNPQQQPLQHQPTMTATSGLLRFFPLVEKKSWLELVTWCIKSVFALGGKGKGGLRYHFQVIPTQIMGAYCWVIIPKLEPTFVMSFGSGSCTNHNSLLKNTTDTSAPLSLTLLCTLGCFRKDPQLPIFSMGELWMFPRKTHCPTWHN